MTLTRLLSHLRVAVEEESGSNGRDLRLVFCSVEDARLDLLWQSLEVTREESLDPPPFFGGTARTASFLRIEQHLLSIAEHPLGEPLLENGC
jgi:hypothetical protein